MNIDLLSLTPHQVSKDLRGYSLLLYGEPKSGKTTTASQFPKALLLAYEKGYKALPGVMAQPMNTWADMIKVMKQLRRTEVQEMYETIVIDTGDLAYEACEKHVCNLHGVDKIGSIDYGAGYLEVARLLDGVLQELARLGYGVIIISHSDDKILKDENGREYHKIQPTLTKTPKRIFTRFCDIIGYSRIVRTIIGEEEIEKTYLYMRGSIRFEAGSRFKYTPEHIEFNYQNLVNAIAEAVEREATEGNRSLTEERSTAYDYQQINYEEVMAKFIAVTKEIMETDPDKQKDIEKIIEKFIGKGRRVGDLDENNVDTIDVIAEELKTLLE